MPAPGQRTATSTDAPCHQRRDLRDDAKDRHTLSVMPTEGFAVPHENTPDHHIPAADEPSVPELEDDETVPPRPEEEIADVLRAKPDLEDHSRQPEA